MIPRVLQRPTLVLNRNWQPVNVATVARALVLLWNESARVVDPADYQTFTWEDWSRLCPSDGERFIQAVRFRLRVAEVTRSDWNVFIEGPPHGRSNPDQLLKYLARYLTGGPISNGRMLDDENGHVTFWARSKNKAAGNRSRPFSLSGREFVRRWSMHILPKGYTRSRCFGGYHGRQRQDYLNRCRELLTIPDPPPIEPPEEIEASPPTCPRCDIEMDCIEKQSRPSWKEVFHQGIYADPAIYSPMLHSRSAGFPATAHEPYG